MNCKDCNTNCHEAGTDGEMCSAWTRKPIVEAEVSKKQPNADRIRAMTDEELREKIAVRAPYLLYETIKGSIITSLKPL